MSPYDCVTSCGLKLASPKTQSINIKGTGCLKDVGIILKLILKYHKGVRDIFNCFRV
jgi:hypothetical protein